ncbi:MAG: hypothetical protein ACREXY_14790 [Gammaproteobacteria bacterium]
MYDFVVNHVRMQFEDIGAMLRLPMQAHGLNNGCNFASASVICNLISGVSVTIFQPAVIEKPDGNMQMIGSGEAFKEFVKAFYPDPLPQRRSDVADVLYKQLRNPFAHALGVLKRGAYQLEIKKVLSTKAATPGDGLTQAEVAAIEDSPQRPGGITLGVQGSGNQWDIIVDFLYRDALDTMVGLAHDATQMQQAEARFQAGTYVWRP